PDRIKGTPDDVVISSGPGTQLVDELTYVGVGNAIAPTDIACVGTSQAMLDCVKTRYDQLIPFALTATYDFFDDSSVLLASGSGTVNFGSCLTITCPPNIVAKAAAGQTSVAVTFPAPVTSDTCGETVQVVCVPASGSQFPVGVTTVVCTATDASGSTATCSFTVEVGDIVLQDPHTGDCLLFDSKTGDYVFTHCGPAGFSLTGKGSVRTIGATVTLTDSKPGRSVMASFLSNQLTGTARVTVQVSPGVFQTFTINSTRPNPSCVCGA
ncbi:MAG: HYR domain-containing protein, partial [Blastocatellia bacterium]